jgi:3D (Asp-Asp-Asp) domain-containing protein
MIEPRKGVFMMFKPVKLILILIVAIGAATSFWVYRPKAESVSLPLPEEYLAGLLMIDGNALISTSPLPEPKVIRKIRVVVTAYSSTVFETDETPFTTAAGTTVKEGIVANNLLPFGTKIRLPELYGDRVFLVQDRMNSRKGYYHIDIWFPSHQEAENFGAKTTYIEILES